MRSRTAAARFGAMMTLTALALFSAACVSLEPVPQKSEVIHVTGVGESQPLALLEQQLAQAAPLPSNLSPVPDASWANRTIGARAVGLPPANWSSVETRRLMAKRDAIGKGWRSIGQQIEAMQIPGDKAVAEYSKYDPAIRQKIEEIIQSARVTGERELPDRSYEVTLVADISRLAEIVPPKANIPQPTPPEANGLTAAQRAQMEAERGRLRAAIRQSAEQDARRRLMEYVKARPLPSGRLMGDAMAKDPALDAQIQGLVADARVSDERRAERGGCEVDLEFDMGRALAAASSR